MAVCYLICLSMELSRREWIILYYIILCYDMYYHHYYHYYYYYICIYVYMYTTYIYIYIYIYIYSAEGGAVDRGCSGLG